LLTKYIIYKNKSFDKHFQKYFLTILVNMRLITAD
jgi:hypothetical protein